MTDSLTEHSAAKLVARECLQWHLAGVDNAAGVIPKMNWDDRGGHTYNLKGLRPRKFLQWEHQTWGINLGWTDDAEPATAVRAMRWFFTRHGSSRNPLRYGETVGMGYGTDPSFIKWGHRDVGINLDWSSSPVFEWQILGGRNGDPVQLLDSAALYNTRANNFLVYFDRDAGGDIGWPDSKTWGDQIIDKITDNVSFDDLVKGAVALYPLL